MEIAGKEPERAVSIENLCDAFEKDAEARGLKESSLEKYKLLVRRLKEFTKTEGIRYARELDIDSLRRFRASWPLKNYAALVATGELKTILRFAHESGWTETNPGKLLRNPEVRSQPVIPFTDEEIKNILTACNSYKTCGDGVYIKSFVLMLLCTGLRIRDVVGLQRNKISAGNLLLYTAKTGEPVNVPLPPACLAELGKIPDNGSGYFFWTGNGKIKTRVGNYQSSLKKLFKLAGVSGHAHKFRHTLAVNLLLQGVPIERVAIALGQSNPRTTLKHYAPWVKARQQQLEADVRQLWQNEAYKSATTISDHQTSQ